MRRDEGPSADEIERMLLDRFEGVVDSLYPGALKRGGIAYCSAKGVDKPRDLGSFHVYLHNHGKYERGQWNRWSEGIGGGVINLIAYRETGNHKGTSAYAAAFAWARDFLGIEDRHESDEERAARLRREDQHRKEAEAKRAADEAKDAKKKAVRRGTAAGVWSDAPPIADTLAERYLVGRGIPSEAFNADPSLRFHPDLDYELDRSLGAFPALVALVTGPDGRGKALWRIFLDPITGGKAPVPNPKVGMASTEGGAVRLGGIASKIGIAEGVETALAAYVLNGMTYPVWAGLSTAGMMAFEVPEGVEHVVIYPDGDSPRDRNGRIIRPGLDAAYRLKERLDAQGIHCTIMQPPRRGDYLDVLAAMRGLSHAA